MREVEQTIFEPPHGNCFAACVASVLELPLDTIPSFEGEEEGERHWYEQWQQWLAERNLTFLTFPVDSERRWFPKGYALLCTQSVNGPWLHSVVALNGEIVWDPSPRRHKGVGEWKDWTVFAVLDPAKAQAAGQGKEGTNG